MLLRLLIRQPKRRKQPERYATFENRVNLLIIKNSVLISKRISLEV